MTPLKYLFAYVFFSLCILVSAQQLSEHSRVTILTVKSGSEIYSMYGHTAIRVEDSLQSLDYVYNYGTFDFDTPDFIQKFVKGDLLYFLSIEETPRQFRYFIREGRPVYEQVLNLSLKQKQKVFDILESTYHSEKRYYRYDMFYDNCVTRIRDVVYVATDSSIIYDSSLFAHQTFRQLVDPYLRSNYWIQLGTHLLLGIAADRKATLSDYMFLPDYLQQFYKTARIKHNMKFTNLAQTESCVLDVSEISTPRRLGVYVMWGISFSVIILSIILYRIRRSARALNIIGLSIFSLIGIFVTFVSIYSEREAVHFNLNILWTLTNIATMFFSIFKIDKVLKMWCYFVIVIIVGLLSYFILFHNPLIILAPLMVIVMMIHINIIMGRKE